jgi:hypothetical protein
MSSDQCTSARSNALEEPLVEVAEQNTVRAESENISAGNYEKESAGQEDLFSGLELTTEYMQRLDAAIAAYQVLTNDAITTQNDESKSGILLGKNKTSSASQVANLDMLELAIQDRIGNAFFVLPEGVTNIWEEGHIC